MVFASLSTVCWGSEVGTPRAFDLRIGPDFVNPVGFSIEDNSLSRKIPFRKGAAQTAYRIQMLSGGKIVADTGKVVSGASATVEIHAENADSVRINGEKPESLRLEKLGCGEYQITITKPKY